MTEKQLYYIFSSRRRHTRSPRDWSSDVCSSDLGPQLRASMTWTPSTARSSRLSAEDPAVSAAPHRPQEAAMTQPDDYEVDPTQEPARTPHPDPDRKSTRLNSSHVAISYAVFCLKKKKKQPTSPRE